MRGAGVVWAQLLALAVVALVVAALIGEPLLAVAAGAAGAWFGYELAKTRRDGF